MTQDQIQLPTNKLTSNSFFVTPIGGVGQIGSNMTLVKSLKGSFLIDTGILFPREKGLGINHLIANFYAYDLSSVEHLFITHCHEDHLGAVKYLIKQLPNLKIYSERFTLEILKNKIQIAPERLITINHLYSTDVADFKVSSFRVNHSTAQTLGFVINHQNTALIYTSDFKVDLKAQFEEPIDFDRVNKLCCKSKKKVALLDSTNILRTGKTPTESELIPNLKKYLQIKRRTIITFFPSNIIRFIELIKMCHELKKVPVLYGRAMHSYYEAAINADLITGKRNQRAYDIDKIDVKDDNTVIFVSGCQGDFRSTLSAVARGQSAQLKIVPGDQVIFSASVIPGNQKQVGHLYNLFTELGAEVITNQDALIHCSGHASQEDLKIFVENVEPTDIIPIHGESYFLQKHLAFINESFPDAKSHLLANHQSVLIGEDIEVLEAQSIEPLIISNNGQELERSIISKRRKISESGLAIVYSKNPGFDISYYGVQISNEHIEEVNKTLISALKKQKSSEEIRISIRKKILELTHLKVIVDSLL
jgi:ribonuclease J